MGREILVLRLQGRPDALERSRFGGGDRGERLLELGGAPCQHRAEQAALRMEVVEQQLLVDPGAPGNLIHSRALEAAARELLARRRDDAQGPGISELRLQSAISSTTWLTNVPASEPERQVFRHSGHPLLQESDQQVVQFVGSLFRNGVASMPRRQEG